MIEVQFERAKNLLREKRKELEIIANELLEKEVLFQKDMANLIGPRPFADKEPLEKKASEPTNGALPMPNPEEPKLPNPLERQPEA
jgi:cell division protease FtsH